MEMYQHAALCPQSFFRPSVTQSQQKRIYFPSSTEGTFRGAHTAVMLEHISLIMNSLEDLKHNLPQFHPGDVVLLMSSDCCRVKVKGRIVVQRF